MKTFTTTGVCTRERNYMVDITDRLEKIKTMIYAGDYFTINRARQYGKTTTLAALTEYLKDDYTVLNIDFQGLDDGSFESGGIFTQALSQLIIDECEFGSAQIPPEFIERTATKITPIPRTATILTASITNTITPGLTARAMLAGRSTTRLKQRAARKAM